MLIHNVRLGFATNSSSTHSIIFLKPGQRVGDSDVEAREFGWDHWTAASKEAKTQYVALTLFKALSNQVNKDVAEAVTDAWVTDYTRSSGKDSFHEGGPEGYIDHQSEMVLPSSWEGKSVDKQFFEDFRDFFLRDDVVILGGNDNTEEHHPLGDADFRLPLPRDGNPGVLVCRKDVKNNCWTVFDRGNGTKIRFSFENPTTDKKVVKAHAPELVDLKITDMCPFGCPWCYQGSTHEGKHGDWNQVINGLAYTLGQMHVFEVAIGGGEPTLHPDFIRIVQQFRYYGVIPSFTTKNLNWLRDPSVWPKVIDAIGAFAFSVDNAGDVKKLGHLLDANEIPHEKANVQFVMGASSLHTMEQIVRQAADSNIAVTLLGYKTTGRGADVKPEPYAGWTKVVEKVQKDGKYFHLGIDTQLARQSATELAKAKIHPKLYEVDEGGFSMYIDAVNKKVGASSYGEPLAMKKLPDFHEDKILGAFSSWGRPAWDKLDTLDAE